MKEYVKIFIAFFKIGLFTFGGGYAMMPMFRKELIEKEGYISEEELMDYYSIGQCTPGIIAVNVATFTGYKIKKSLGAIVATFAVVLPSLIVILLIASVIKDVLENETFLHVANGIRIGVVVLLLNEVFKIFKKNVKSKFQIIVFIGAVLLIGGVGCSSVLAILIALLVGGGKFLWENK